MFYLTPPRHISTPPKAAVATSKCDFWYSPNTGHNPDIREVLTINTRRALVGTALGIGVRQNILAADLVVQGVEAIAGFCLRFRVQRRLQFLNTGRSC